jgi:hypothetical protein
MEANWRHGIGLGVLICVAGLAGCAMCGACYDECYPGYPSCGDPTGCRGPRAGSIRAMGTMLEEAGPAYPQLGERSPSTPAGQTGSPPGSPSPGTANRQEGLRWADRSAPAGASSRPFASGQPRQQVLSGPSGQASPQPASNASSGQPPWQQGPIPPSSVSFRQEAGSGVPASAHPFPPSSANPVPPPSAKSLSPSSANPIPPSAHGLPRGKSTSNLPVPGAGESVWPPGYSGGYPTGGTYPTYPGGSALGPLSFLSQWLFGPPPTYPGQKTGYFPGPSFPGPSAGRMSGGYSASEGNVPMARPGRSIPGATPQGSVLRSPASSGRIAQRGQVPGQPGSDGAVALQGGGATPTNRPAGQPAPGSENLRGSQNQAGPQLPEKEPVTGSVKAPGTLRSSQNQAASGPAGLWASPVARAYQRRYVPGQSGSAFGAARSASGGPGMPPAGVPPEVWAAIPPEDRATAQILSITDRKLEPAPNPPEPSSSVGSSPTEVASRGEVSSTGNSGGLQWLPAAPVPPATAP